MCEQRLAPSNGNDPILEPFGGFFRWKAGPPAPVALPACCGGGSHFTLGFRGQGILQPAHLLSGHPHLFLIKKTFTVWSQDHFLTNWSSYSQKNLKVNQNETDRIIHRSTSFRYRVSQERPRNYERKINFVFGQVRTCSSQCCGYGSGHVGSGSGSDSQSYGSGSFYHQAKIVKKTLIPTVLWLLYNVLS